ncbi:MAG: GNAT family N-acetyltransferase, partial [Microbacteriaceae bacterium]
MSAWPSLSVRDPGDPTTLSAFSRLAERVHATDGHPAFNDGTLTDLTGRTVRSVDHGDTLAAAVVTGGFEVEFAVDPEHRRLGIGSSIVRQLLAENVGQVTAWAHGNHPAAQALAARFGFQPFRTLLQLRARVPSEVG